MPVLNNGLAIYGFNNWKTWNFAGDFTLIEISAETHHKQDLNLKIHTLIIAFFGFGVVFTKPEYL